MADKRQHRKNCNDPGDAHALTFSCYKRLAMLKAERTCEWLKESIDTARQELEFSVWAFVFMPEHAHLLIWPRRSHYDVAVIRQRIKEPVGRKAIAYLEEHSPGWLPKLTRRRGGKIERLFWQSGGGYNRNIKSTRVLLGTIDYIHMNPVRRGLVEKPVEWKWSSAAWYLTGQPTPLAIDPIPPEWMSMDDDDG